MYPKKENPKVKEHKICIFHDYLPQIFTPKLQIGWATRVVKPILETRNVKDKY